MTSKTIRLEVVHIGNERMSDRAFWFWAHFYAILITMAWGIQVLRWVFL